MRSLLLSAPVVGLVVIVAWTMRTSSESVPLAAEPIVVTRPFVDTTVRLQHNETLTDALGRVGLTAAAVFAMLDVTDRLNPRRLRPGTAFHVRIPLDQRPTRVMVRLNDEERLWWSRRGERWVADVEQVEWRTERFRVTGRLRGILWLDLQDAIPAHVLPGQQRDNFRQQLIDIYDWVIDFSRDLRPGDAFTVLAERRVSAEGDVVFGRIVAAIFETNKTPRYAFGLPGGDGRLDYYDDGGTSLRRMFLRTPIRQGRLSSHYGRRRHPILGRMRQHDGTDYAAAYNTPVRATAAGTIIFAGRDGGYGNLIRVRHGKGYETRYAHLNKFRRGLRSGTRVEQGEIIGYVGSTGLSTAPHVHYEFHRNGKALNSRRVDLGDGTPVPAGKRGEFEGLMTRYLSVLGPPTPDWGLWTGE